jgi:nucleoside-diphosphate-sugar epimerase
MNQKLRIVITGATGFIGQHLLEDIDAEKNAITIITRDKNKAVRFLPHNSLVVEADLLNVDSLKSAFKNQDVLINLAAEVRNIEKLAQTNIAGTQNLIEALTQSEIKQVIHLSSVGVVGKSYSNSILNVDETTICTPQNEYERTKFISENLFLESRNNNSFKLTILRPTNVYGEYHTFNALLRLMKHIETGKSLAYQKGAMVNYVYVKDLTSLICNLIENKEEYGVVDVGGAEVLETFLSVIAKKLNVRLKSIIIPSILIKFVQILGINKLNPVSNKVTYSDKKLSSFYTYKFGADEGLKRTIEHYRKIKLLK